jgi:transcriptional regulator with XRE-family HTH domain
MSQIDSFLAALKLALKEKSLTYRDIAKGLKLSESTIKRILTNKSISLKRLEDICRIADINIAELIKSVETVSGDRVYIFSDLQEQAFAQNHRLLQFYFLLRDGKTSKQILNEYEILESESQKFLHILDKLGLIELHVLDRVKLKVKGHFKFRQNGPIARDLFLQAKLGFLDYNFKQEDYLRFSVVKASPSLLAKYKTKAENLFIEIQEEAQFEAAHCVNGTDVGFLIAQRPWQYSFRDVIALKKDKSSNGGRKKTELSVPMSDISDIAKLSGLES